MQAGPPAYILEELCRLDQLAHETQMDVDEARKELKWPASTRSVSQPLDQPLGEHVKWPCQTWEAWNGG